MQEPQCTFEIFINKMGDNVLKLLSFLHRKKAIFNTVRTFLSLSLL